jgi:bilirubin oxidase
MRNRIQALAAFAASVVTAAAAASVQAAPLPGGTLPPESIPRYAQPLVIPPAMPPASTAGGRDRYEIAVRQFEQQILPPGLPKTTVWSYGAVDHPATFHYPAFTIEARTERPVRVKWINDLVDAEGNYLPHIVPVDQTLHWANPPGGEDGRDGHGMAQEPYTGPVPLVVHLHGAHAKQDSDGFPEAWFLPAAKNLPEGFATVGRYYEQFRAEAEARLGEAWEPGTAVFQYENDQEATTLWYHDHTLGMTRANVYAGPAGFYLLRGGRTDLAPGILPGPAPAPGDAPGTRYYEIPIVIQDRSFDADGALSYADSRAFFDGFEGPYHPDQTADGATSDVAPIWNPEFFGNTMVVNGRTWPYLEVEQRRYRFRLLNGCNSRFLVLELEGKKPDGKPLPFWQIGADGGFLPEPVRRSRILLAPAERADVIVDFSKVPEGTRIRLLNLGPDEPFGGGEPGVDFAVADPGTTGQVMELRVVAATGEDTSTPPQRLRLPRIPRLPRATHVRQLSLNELDSASVCVDPDTNAELPCSDPASAPFGPQAAMLGSVMFGPDGMPMGMPMMWMEQVSEKPRVGSTEVWELYNFTMDAHPMHIHEVQFEIVSREPFDPMAPGYGKRRGPEAGEAGRKDTVIAYPGEITRVKATFDQAGLFVWHCHIVEHEDNEMMRPYEVVAEGDQHHDHDHGGGH